MFYIHPDARILQEKDIQEFIWTAEGILKENLNNPNMYTYGVRKDVILNCNTTGLSDSVQRVSSTVEEIITKRENETSLGTKTIRISPQWLVKYNKRNHRDSDEDKSPSLPVLRTIALKHKQNEQFHAQFLGAEFIEPEYWFVRNTETPMLCRITRNLRTKDDLNPLDLDWHLQLGREDRTLSEFKDHPLYEQLIKIKTGIIRMIDEKGLFPDLTLETNICITPNGRIKIYDTDTLLCREGNWPKTEINKTSNRLL